MIHLAFDDFVEGTRREIPSADDRVTAWWSRSGRWRIFGEYGVCVRFDSTAVKNGTPNGPNEEMIGDVEVP